jgi:hypothetical protein
MESRSPPGDAARLSALVREEHSPCDAVQVDAGAVLLLGDVERVHPPFRRILQPVDPAMVEMKPLASIREA